MVELENEHDTVELSKKINVFNKNVKMLIVAIDTLMKKLDEHVIEKTPEEEKKKMEQIFEKRGLGRPSGNWESKRQQYLKMLNENKIRQPKTATMQHYKIKKEGEKYVLLD